MDTSLQNTNIGDEQVLSTEAAVQEEEAESEGGHAHFPIPSLWPLIVSLAIFISIAGFLAINSAPWITITGAVLVLIGILGWGLENPEAHAAKEEEEAKPGEYATSFAEAATTGKLTPFAAQTLQEAEEVLESKVTISSTEWSAHPVKVFVEREGVVLSLYGKVELEEQKKEIEDALRQIPGVLDVMNFLVAEDELQRNVSDAIERLRAAGKLEGAKDLSFFVENYVVSLYGEVPNAQMKYLLEKEITGLPGVRVVINHIGVNNEIPGNVGRTANRIARI